MSDQPIWMAKVNKRESAELLADKHLKMQIKEILKAKWEGDLFANAWGLYLCAEWSNRFGRRPAAQEVFDERCQALRKALPSTRRSVYPPKGLDFSAVQRHLVSLNPAHYGPLFGDLPEPAEEDDWEEF
jgi:hypothetical protein